MVPNAGMSLDSENDVGGRIADPKALKAHKVLGRDTSKEKIMNTLGVDENEFQLAEQERLDYIEEQLKW